MKGKNTIELNKMTVLEALNEYFKKRIRGEYALYVRDVRACTSPSPSGFVVVTVEPSKDPRTPADDDE